jgi:hypothetical protein
MRAYQFIKESNLATGEIVKYKDRVAKFLAKVKNKSPFEVDDGSKFIVDPKQYNELATFLNNPNAKGGIKLRSIDGKTTIPSGRLVKTSEFNGQSVAKTAAMDNSAEAGKEQLKVKPPQVFKTTDIADVNLATAKDLQRAGAFKVKDLYSKIVERLAPLNFIRGGVTGAKNFIAINAQNYDNYLKTHT